MTWGELKAQMAAAGVLDSDAIDFIDISSSTIYHEELVIDVEEDLDGTRRFAVHS